MYLYGNLNALYILLPVCGQWKDIKEKEFKKALRKLTPVFQKLAAKDVSHYLYEQEQLTWNEFEHIGEVQRGEALLVTCTGVLLWPQCQDPSACFLPPYV